MGLGHCLCNWFAWQKPAEHKWRKASVMLRPPWKRILFSRQVQPAYICLPSKNGAHGRTLTLISDVRTIALYGLSYASRFHPGAPETVPGLVAVR